MYLYNQPQIKPLFGKSLPWKEKEEEQKIDIEELKKEAYLKGLKEGTEKGRQEAEKRAEEQIKKIRQEYEEEKKRVVLDAVSRLTEIVRQVSALREEIITKADEDILKIALMVAKKLVKSELSHNKEVVINNIKEALNNAIERDKVIVRIHPEDYERLKDVNALKELLNVDELIIQKDDSVAMKGGCIVETRYSEIDARLETQLRAIEKVILGNGK